MPTRHQVQQAHIQYQAHGCIWSCCTLLQELTSLADLR